MAKIGRNMHYKGETGCKMNQKKQEKKQRRDSWKENNERVGKAAMVVNKKEKNTRFPLSQRAMASLIDVNN